MPASCAYKISENNQYGRFLVAARDIEKGEIILTEDPLIMGPAQETGPVCLSCLQNVNEENSVKCLKCGWPLCDDKNCLTNINHKPECEWTTNRRKEQVKITSFVTPHKSYECLTLIRCLYQKENNPKVWQKLMNLESHDDQIRNSERYKMDFQMMNYFLYNFFKIDKNEYDEKVILKVYGLLQINAHEVPLTDQPYIAIYDKASLLEHNCLPNSCKSFTGKGSILIRAVADIKKGEHISICYTDSLWSTVNRQEHLLSTKYFLCQCRRCIDGTELGTYYSSLRCLEKKCDGLLVPNTCVSKEKIVEADWKCNKCDGTKDKNKIMTMLTRIAEDYAMTDKQSSSSCEIFLRHYSENLILSLNHYFLSNARLKLAQLYGQTTANGVEGLSNIDLDRKIVLCKQALDFANFLYGAEWRLIGMLKFELHAAVAEHARRRMLCEVVDKEKLQSELLESKKWLEETIFHLKYEPEILPEGKIVKQCEKNLSDLESLLVRLFCQL